MLRPQDILVLLKLATGVERQPWLQQDVARALGISQAEMHKSLKRVADAGLFPPEKRKVMREALLELLIHGIRHIFPVHLGGPARGIRTAWAAPILADRIVSAETDQPVWPYAEGDARGPSVTPLYASAPKAATLDPALYELLAIVDALRLGGARERSIAADLLRKRLSA